MRWSVCVSSMTSTSVHAGLLKTGHRERIHLFPQVYFSSISLAYNDKRGQPHRTRWYIPPARRGPLLSRNQGRSPPRPWRIVALQQRHRPSLRSKSAVSNQTRKERSVTRMIRVPKTRSQNEVVTPKLHSSSR